MKRMTTMMQLWNTLGLNIHTGMAVGNRALRAPHLPEVHVSAQSLTAGIVAGSVLVFATVGMVALMAVADLAHAETVDDTYNLSKPVEPSGVTPLIMQERSVTTDGVTTRAQAVTVVNQDGAIVNTVETRDVRVLLPTGEVIVVANPINAPWWQDERVASYRTYYYEPDKQYYVIYDEQNRPWSKWEKRWDESGRPCGRGVTAC